MKKFLIAWCIMSLAVIGAVALRVGTASVSPSQITIQELFEATNRERINAGLPALVLDLKLNNSALEKCKNMVANNYWSHSAPDGTEPWVFIDKYTEYLKAAENLAYGMYSAQNTLDEWMASPSHKENIVESRYDNVGFGVCKSANYIGKGQQVVIVQHFTDVL